MANLLITNKCNRKCSFCFAKKRLNRSQSTPGAGNMSLQNISQVLDFLESSDEYNMRLLGGEPTLHPDFIKIVKQALNRDFLVHVFTNGVMFKEVADFLGSLSSNQLSVLCNVSPQAKDSKKMNDMKFYAFEKLGSKLNLGITITSPEFEYDYLINLIKRFKLRKSIRIGIAQPLIGEDNEYLPPAKYRDTGTFLAQMATKCIEEDILIGFDCGLTLCMFSEEEIGLLAKCSEGFSPLCRPIIDIGPELDVWHCFPLSEVLNTHLNNFTTHSRIVNFYNKITNPFRSIGCKPECLRCDYLRRNQCTGGCLAHAMNSLNRIPPKFARDADNKSHSECKT